MDVSEKIRRKKRLLKMFWQKMKSWWAKDTDQRIIDFVDLCNRMGIMWSTTTLTRVSDATEVTFCVKCFNPNSIFCQSTSPKSGLLELLHAFYLLTNIFTAWPAVSDVFLAVPYNPCSFFQVYFIWCITVLCGLWSLWMNEWMNK